MASTIIATKLMDRLPTTACKPNKFPIKSNPTDSSRKPASIITGIIEGFEWRARSLTRRSDRSYGLGRVHTIRNHTNDHRRGSDYGNNQPFQTKRFLMAV